ncbi:hypothetical protein [Pseudonocardia alaniniphila]|uniref:Uncharacterized protein n=1 Tax=Pseudonocardia alaniniphila TaxID=75291 RepID=A0ABS9TRX2_9PSEU|nr:hypothetical protein [Pseudonocardia alaniniphila]MCH6171309.1 hypothetical protein [Pseudonocardia alaniniphila]
MFYDLVSVQYHPLKAGHDYGQYVRDAKNGGFDDIAGFFEQVMYEGSERAKCPSVPRPALWHRARRLSRTLTEWGPTDPATEGAPPLPDPGSL